MQQWWGMVVGNTGGDKYETTAREIHLVLFSASGRVTFRKVTPTATTVNEKKFWQVPQLNWHVSSPIWAFFALSDPSCQWKIDSPKFFHAQRGRHSWLWFSQSSWLDYLAQSIKLPVVGILYLSSWNFAFVLLVFCILSSSPSWGRRPELCPLYLICKVDAQVMARDGAPRYIWMDNVTSTLCNLLWFDTYFISFRGGEKCNKVSSKAMCTILWYCNCLLAEFCRIFRPESFVMAQEQDCLSVKGISK